MNLILCGMMGSGKTTVGKALSKLSGKPFFDTDAVIEEKHGAITDIFSTHGEGYFRALETQAVKELAQGEESVISTGGGLVLLEENVTLLKQTGKIVYLSAELSTLEKRLAGDTSRPLLQTGQALKDRLERLLQTRAPVYRSVADLTVQVDGKTPEKIAEEIIKKLTPES